MHPALIDLISIDVSFRKSESTSISPNSFSINTTFSFFKVSFSSFLIRVVLPDPRKPDIISIFVILYLLSPFKLYSILKNITLL